MKRSTAAIAALVVASMSLGACDPKTKFRFPDADHRADFVDLQEYLLATYPTPGEARDAGYGLPAHLDAVIAGCGYTLARDHHIPHGYSDLTEPLLLFYDSSDSVRGRLIGWAYPLDYEPCDWPSLPGVPEEAWFVHEAGWHLSDGDMILTPPEEEYAGQLDMDDEPESRPTGGLVWHGRTWDLHVWVNPTGGVPVMSIFEPFGYLRDSEVLTLDDGAFFYPESAPLTPIRTGPAPGWKPSSSFGGRPGFGSR